MNSREPLKVKIDLELNDDIFNPDSNSTKMFSEVQGAKLLPEAQNFVFGKKDNEGRIREIIFEIEDNKYLKDFIDRIPFGIINKKATGIGATTLELECPRNSIIVVPTKSLAYTKHMKYPDSLYVGSEIGTINNPVDKDAITSYATRSDIENKKIIVVADSLPKVISAIGESVYTTYFLMIDEIDVLQSDSSFRKALEQSMDCYFDFPLKNKSVVSATIRDFSHPLLKNETIVTIEKKNPLSRTIKLIQSENKNINATLKELIEGIPHEKIVIAYNSVTEIMSVISSLNSQYQSECGVLCSPASKENVRNHFRELNDPHLFDRITFMTCSYFVGVDIEDRFHLITVANTQRIPQPLSINKIIQIHGRCRNADGIFSDTILFSGLEEVSQTDFSLEEYEQFLIDKSKIAIDICNLTEQYKKEHSLPINDPALNDIFITIKEKLAEASIVNNVPTIRFKGKKQQADYSYFNIDNLLEKAEIIHKRIYSDIESLRVALKEMGHTVRYDISEAEPSLTQILNESGTRIDQDIIKNEMAQRAVDKIKTLELNNNLNNNSLNELIKRNAPDRTEHLLCKRFKALYEFIPTEPLLDILLKFCTATDRPYKRIYNALIFWSLSNDHPFKAEIRRLFPIGQRFTKHEILDKLTPLVRTFLGVTIRNEQEAVNFLDWMCKKYSTKVTRNGVASDGYGIRDFIPKDIELLKDHQPKSIIPYSETLLRNRFNVS